MRDERPRQLAAIAALVVATGALLATSYSPTAYGDASGEMTVGPGDPTEVLVRFSVPAEGADRIARIAVDMFTRASTDARLSVATLASISGTDALEPGPNAELDPVGCDAGCTIEASFVARMVAPSQGPLVTDWRTEARVDYESSEPTRELPTTVVSSGGVLMPRATWVVIGVVLAAAAAAGFVALGPRFAIPRLVLAAALLVLAAWPWVQVAPYLLPGRAVSLYFDWQTALILGGSVVVLVGVAAGLWRAWRGRPTVLRVIGTVGALLLGFLWWQLVESLPAYRPHEVALYTLGIMLPASAAMTAAPAREDSHDPRPAISLATAIVIAAQALMALVAFAAAGAVILSVVAFVVNLIVRPEVQRSLDLLAVAAVVIPIAVAWQFVIGLLAWRRGRWRPLFVADVPVALAVIALTIFVLVQGERDLLSFDAAAKVLAVIGALVVLIGTIGVGLVRPPVSVSGSEPAPPADDERDEQRRHGDEVRRVGDEGHGTELGDRP
jgi:hypothetical protein